MQISTQVALSDKNWFQTGGFARFFCQPKSFDELREGILYARRENLSIFILGQGANVLINDDGFDGLVINPCMDAIELLEERQETVLVKAQAGVRLDLLIDFCLQNNSGGLEEFSGIPSSVGGAVYINVHYFEFLISQFLLRAEVIERGTGLMQEVDNAWFEFGYNRSRLLQQTHYLVSATFSLKKLSAYQAAYACGRRHEIIRQRSKRYPASHTCGSFFRNFYQEELAAAGQVLPYVAYYFDNVGIKGSLAHGKAIVSSHHANMLINRGGARSDEIISLAKTMQLMVYEKFKLLPQPECHLVGFKEYPLLKL